MHIKDPGRSSRLLLNTHVPSTQRSRSWLAVLSRHSAGTYCYQGNKFTHNSSGKHLATVVSDCWATVGWSWLRERTWCAWVDLHLKKRKEKKKTHVGMIHQISFHKNHMLAKSHHHHTGALSGACESYPVELVKQGLSSWGFQKIFARERSSLWVLFALFCLFVCF